MEIMQWKIVLLFMQQFVMIFTECNKPFGMESGYIKNNQITASHWLYHKAAMNKHYAPHLARLNTNTSSGGWCSEDTQQHKNQYIQIDLLSNKRITSLATQGRYGSLEYVEAFKIMYQRNHDSKFRKYIEENEWKIFQANRDSTSVKRHLFNRPIIARHIRIYPIGEEFAINCMRLEIYGCKWAHDESGLVEYEAPFGSQYSGINMGDTGYDGELNQSNGTYFNGIGKLSDDVYGTERLNTKKLSPWIAYKSPSPIITFKFYKERIFKQVIIHINKMNKGDDLFEKVRISSSFDGIKYSVIKYHVPSRDEYYQRTGAFAIVVNLGQVLTKYIQLEFTNKKKLLLISEVAFISEAYRKDIESRTNRPIIVKTVPVYFTGFPFHTRKPPTDIIVVEEQDAASETKGLSFPIILTIALVTLLIAVAIAIFTYKTYKRKQKSNSHCCDDSSTAQLKKSSPVSHSLSFTSSSHPLNKQQINSLLYDENRLTYPFQQQQQQQQQSNTRATTPLVQDGMYVYPVMQPQHAFNQQPMYITT